MSTIETQVEPIAVPPREAKRILGGISERHLWALTQPRGPIPSVRLGRRVVYRVAALQEFLADQERGEK